MFLHFVCLLLNPCSTKSLKILLDLPFTLGSPDAAGWDAPKIVQDLIPLGKVAGANTSFLVATK